MNRSAARRGSPRSASSHGSPLRPAVTVVHLARHRERRQRLASALDRHGFSRVMWLNAVDGRELDPVPPWRVGPLPPTTPWSGWIDPYARRAMTLGEVGCALSHVLAWQRIAKSGYPGLVIEDDAVPVEPLMDSVPMLMRDLDHLDFDLCYLAQRNDPGPKPLAGRHVHLVDYHPLWTLAYLLSPEGARKLTASPWRDRLAPADEMLPACFGLNRDAAVNSAYAGSPGLVLATNQRFFTPWESSVASETEKSPPVREPEAPLLALTVATEERPELRRLLDSGLRYGFAIEPLGLGLPWRGGDIAAGPGGGQKVNLLRPALERISSERPVLFLDGYDTIVTRHARDILGAWHEVAGGAPLFAAELFCWPDKARAARYPEVPDGSPYRFLNSGAFIGRVGDLLRIAGEAIDDSDDDQRYYTERFLSGEHGIVLDHGCRVFQCLNGALEHVSADEGRGMIYNSRTQSWPAVIHANGPTKPWLEGDGRAVGGRWRTYYGEMT